MLGVKKIALVTKDPFLELFLLTKTEGHKLAQSGDAKDSAQGSFLEQSYNHEYLVQNGLVYASIHSVIN